MRLDHLKTTANLTRLSLAHAAIILAIAMCTQGKCQGEEEVPRTLSKAYPPQTYTDNEKYYREAYSSIPYRAVNSRMLFNLSHSSNDHVAINSKWAYITRVEPTFLHQHHISFPSKMENFIGFLEARLECGIPDIFEHSLRYSTAEYNTLISADSTIHYFWENTYLKDYDFHGSFPSDFIHIPTEKNSRFIVNNNKTSTTININNHEGASNSYKIPRRKEPRETHGEVYISSVGESTVIITSYHSHSIISFFASGNQDELWHNSIWGLYNPSSTSGALSKPYMKIATSKDSIILFTQLADFSTIERFSKLDGKCDLRFSTILDIPAPSSIQ